GATLGAAREQLAPPPVEALVKGCDEGEGVVCEHLVEAVVDRCLDVDAGAQAGDHTCTRSDRCANICSIMVVCVLLKRLPLIAALGGTRRELMGKPVALAPEPGREQRVGEVSPAAEAFGIVPGMRVGEALAR